MASPRPFRLRYRSLFVSDLHLGTRGCKAALLLDFLKHTESDSLYLVGDIIDGWWLKRFWHWPQAHNDVVQKLLRKARKGTQVIYLPGNHDEGARKYFGVSFGGVRILERVVHRGLDGRRHLVLHGDQFDGVVRHSPWLTHLGSGAYQMAIWVNDGLNWIRRRLGLPYWSLSAFLKRKTKEAVKYVTRFEELVAGEALRRGLDGVICGHIHKAEIRQIRGIAYANSGDWVESCTALAEHHDGRWEIVDWRRVVGEGESRPSQRGDIKPADPAR